MSERICIILTTIMKFCAHWAHRLRYDEFRRRWNLNSVSQVCAALNRPKLVNVSIVRNSGTRYMLRFRLYSQFSVGS